MHPPPIELHTHFVTDTFSKLNLLGLMEIAWNSPYVIPEEVMRGPYGYRLVLRTTDASRAFTSLVQNLGSVIERREIDEVLGLLRYAFVKNNVDGVRKLVRGNEGQQALAQALQQAGVIHSRGASKKGSPTLFLAPDLGKFGTYKIPYESSYPNPLDNVGDQRISLCTVLSLIGFSFRTFRMTITRRGTQRHACALLAPVSRLGYRGVRILYSISGRLAEYSRISEEALRRLARGRGGGEEGEIAEPSSLAILAFLAPVLKDAAPYTGSGLEGIEIVLYSVTIEGGKQYVRKQYVRELVLQPARYVANLPDALAGAMLARYKELPALLLKAPDFFNTLGEYLVSGDERLYVEALRELASFVHQASSDRNSAWLSKPARFLLRNSSR